MHKHTHTQTHVCTPTHTQTHLMPPASCLESQGCHLIPLSYPSYLLFSFFFFFFCFLLMVHCADFLFSEISPVFFILRCALFKTFFLAFFFFFFCMAVVGQHGDDFFVGDMCRSCHNYGTGTCQYFFFFFFFSIISVQYSYYYFYIFL